MPLKIKPCHLRAAREYVGQHHRHNIPPVGGKFAVACFDGEAGGKRWTGKRRRAYYVAPAELKHRWIKKREVSSHGQDQDP